MVPGEDWTATVVDLVAQGFCWLDFLTAIDRQDTIEVLARLVDPASHADVLVVTSVPGTAPVLASVTEVLPGANWHERETAEMFGVTFTGHPDPRPLLTRPGSSRPPMLKSTPLPARAEATWPGAEPLADSSSARRRGRPPGVLETWERS
jgi:NADH-quinone oxidoreductase subunit C